MHDDEMSVVKAAPYECCLFEDCRFIEVFAVTAPLYGVIVTAMTNLHGLLPATQQRVECLMSCRLMMTRQKVPAKRIGYVGQFPKKYCTFGVQLLGTECYLPFALIFVKVRNAG